MDGEERNRSIIITNTTTSHTKFSLIFSFHTHSTTFRTVFISLLLLKAGKTFFFREREREISTKEEARGGSTENGEKYIFFVLSSFSRSIFEKKNEWIRKKITHNVMKRRRESFGRAFEAFSNILSMHILHINLWKTKAQLGIDWKYFLSFLFLLFSTSKPKSHKLRFLLVHFIFFHCLFKFYYNRMEMGDETKHKKNLFYISSHIQHESTRVVVIAECDIFFHFYSLRCLGCCKVIRDTFSIEFYRFFRSFISNFRLNIVN